MKRWMGTGTALLRVSDLLLAGALVVFTREGSSLVSSWGVVVAGGVPGKDKQDNIG